MTKLHEIYRCNICGNIISLMHTGAGELVCCGQPMQLLVEETEEMSTEKHKPIVEKDGDKLKVKVGSEPHPMENDHYIEWINVFKNGTLAFTHFLKPGDNPEATFKLNVDNGDQLIVRAYCNIHGLWRN